MGAVSSTLLRGAPPSPGLTPDKVRMMVLHWGIPVDRFSGTARMWADEAKRTGNPVRVLSGGAQLAGAGQVGDVGGGSGGRMSPTMLAPVGRRGGGGGGGGRGRGGRGHGGRGHHHGRHWRGGGFYPYYFYPYYSPYYYSPYGYYGGLYGYPYYDQSYAAQSGPTGPMPQDCCADEAYGVLECGTQPGDGVPIQINNRKFYGSGQIVHVSTPDSSRDGWYWLCPAA